MTRERKRYRWRGPERFVPAVGRTLSYDDAFSATIAVGVDLVDRGLAVVDAPTVDAAEDDGGGKASSSSFRRKRGK